MRLNKAKQELNEPLSTTLSVLLKILFISWRESYFPIYSSSCILHRAPVVVAGPRHKSASFCMEKSLPPPAKLIFVERSRHGFPTQAREYHTSRTHLYGYANAKSKIEASWECRKMWLRPIYGRCSVNMSLSNKLVLTLHATPKLS